MKRLKYVLLLITIIGLLPLWSATSFAQADDEMTFEDDEVAEGEVVLEEDEPLPEPDDNYPEPDADLPEPGDGSAPAKTKKEKGEHISWKDIVVVVRKPFLKVNRLEILPTWGVTMNDNLVQHVQLAGQLNYFLTDVLAVGIEGAYYIKNLREPFDQVARQARRLPTLNEYKYAASLNFHYVPIYGKFSILDKHIIHWETFFTAGVGITKSETILRDPNGYEPFTNMLITPNVGVSMRFFITKWLTFNMGMRDYMFNDRFESSDRSSTTDFSADAGRENADSKFVNNLVFQAGLSFWFPTSFEYTTFR